MRQGQSYVINKRTQRSLEEITNHPEGYGKEKYGVYYQ